MFASSFLQNGFLQTMRNVTFAAPAQVFCGLFLSSPGESGTLGTEISYDGYTRMPIIFAPPTIEGSGIGIRNTTQITYPQSLINAGTVRHIGIFDSATGGNMYLYGELSEDLPILEGESPVLLINEVLFFSIGDMSNSYKTRLFNVIRGTTLPGFNPHIALYNGNPQSGGVELLGENYVRVGLTFSAPLVEISGMTTIRNSESVNFNRPTSNWGNWTHTALMSTNITGEPVWIQQRNIPKMLNRGIMPMIETGAITVGVN